MIGYFQHDSLKNVSQIGPYSAATTTIYAKRNAAEIFDSLLSVGTTFYRLFFIGGEPVMLLPSQTMLKLYTDTLNLGRHLKVVRRLGVFQPAVMERHSDKNERAINLFAPGITNPIITHGQVVYPWTGLEHDDYHILFEAQLSKKILAQIDRVKFSLRKVIKDDALYTSEIFRCIDREREPCVDDTLRFYELMMYIFAYDIHDENTKLQTSSVIPLIDMVLEPTHWPYYSALKEKLVNKLLPCTRIKAADHVKDVEQTIRNYAYATKNDYSLYRHTFAMPLLFKRSIVLSGITEFES